MALAVGSVFLAGRALGGLRLRARTVPWHEAPIIGASRDPAKSPPPRASRSLHDGPIPWGSPRPYFNPARPPTTLPASATDAASGAGQDTGPKRKPDTGGAPLGSDLLTVTVVTGAPLTVSSPTTSSPNRVDENEVGEEDEDEGEEEEEELGGEALAHLRAAEAAHAPLAGSLFGAIALVAGSSIGAGVLALPQVRSG